MESGQQFGLYVIRDVIEAGENQFFYCAEDPFFNREVTLKLFPIDQFSDKQSLSRLEDRLEHLAVLEHLSIAPIYDSGNEDGYFYYTSVFFNTESLSQRVDTAALGDEQALTILFELTQALDYSLQQGVDLSLPTAAGICFDMSGHAVISDLGINDLVNRLAAGKEERTVDLEEQLRALGLLLLQMLLGPQFNPAEQPESQLLRVKNDRIRQLLGRFLLPEEWPFENYAELLAELRGFGDLDYQSDSTVDPEPQTLDQDATDKAQTETEKMIADVRQLVAEKNRLQQSLDEALYNRGQVEKKLKEGEHQIVLAQREIARVKEEANVAWELVAGQKYDRWRPVVWAAGGFIVGFLLSGGYGYYYSEQTRNELLAKLQKNEELIKTAGWREQKNETPKTTKDVVAAPVSVDEKTVSVDNVAEPPKPDKEPAELVPVAESAHEWWPAGSEFSANAAIPMEKITAVLGLKGQGDNNNLPDMIRQDVKETVRRWADSWSRQDLEEYFSFYSSDYRPELGRSQEEWRKIRTVRVTRPKWIKLDVEDFQLRRISENRIQVKLKQSYRSDFYQDKILKSINLIKEDGQWRILMERSLGMVSMSSGDMVGG